MHPLDQPKDQTRGAFGLTQEAVDRLREIMRREYGEELTNEEAWAKAIELISLFRALLEWQAVKLDEE